MFVLFAGEQERILSMFNQNEGTELLQNALNLLAEPAWMQSKQLHANQLDIFSGLINAFSQLNDYTGILLKAMTIETKTQKYTEKRSLFLSILAL